MKVFVTKYWQTLGIVEKDGEIEDHGMFQSNEKWNPYYHKNQFFTNREDAVKRAEFLRQKKIKALQDQISKIEEIKF